MTGPWNRGDGGQSAGPFQINSPGNGGVDLAKAETIPYAVAFMAPRYIAAVNQVPADLWNTNAKQAAAQAAYIAERPAAMYSPARVNDAWTALHGGNGSAGINQPIAPDPHAGPTPGQPLTPAQIGDIVNGGGAANPFGALSNPLAPIGTAIGFFSDPRNGIAIVFVVAGVALVIGGLFAVANHDGAISDNASKAAELAA
jgi:hypothetical protein